MSRRRRGGHGGGGGGGGHGGGDARWLVTYADLLTLLMVLFLVLWVISTIDLEKFKKFKEGLGDFGNPAAEAEGPSTGTGEGDAGTVVTDPETGETIVVTTTTTTPGGEGGGEGDGLTGVLDEEGLAELEGGLQGAIDQAGLGGVVSLDIQQRGLVISVTTDDVLFASGSATLESDAVSIIGAIAPQLGTIANTIIVEGYTDKRPLRRAGYDNWDLSVDRAVSVVKLLRDVYGIAPERLAATGYGEQHPIATGDDPVSYARNRRVQIVIVAAEVAEVTTPDAATTTTTAAETATTTAEAATTTTTG